MEITIGLAFIAGLASFLSPCVVSIIPVYISYLSGKTISDNMNEKKADPYLTFLHGFMFILGFSIVFILFGFAFSGIGNLLYQGREYIEKLGGIIIVLFGLHVVGILNIRFLNYDIHLRKKIVNKLDLLTSFVLGILFSAGWSPCIGPILGSILIIALDTGNVESGIVLMASYSFGMAIPFLLAALTTGWLVKFLSNNKKILRIIEVISGIIMISVGILLFLGVFRQLNHYGLFFSVK